MMTVPLGLLGRIDEASEARGANPTKGLLNRHDRRDAEEDWEKDKDGDD